MAIEDITPLEARQMDCHNRLFTWPPIHRTRILFVAYDEWYANVMDHQEDYGFNDHLQNALDSFLDDPVAFIVRADRAMKIK